MLPVMPMSPPGAAFSALTSSSREPDRTVLFSHAGSVSVDDTTYLCTWLRWAVKPVVSWSCSGQ
jgi:hypothetical protein